MDVDILIRKRNNTSTIVGDTNRGKRWMLRNYKSITTTIPTDVLEDFMKDLTNLKLSYEEV